MEKFSDKLELFFRLGSEGKIPVNELKNKKNELLSIHKQMLFLNDTENAKLRANLRKIKINQVSTREELLETTSEYKKLFIENKEKLEKMSKKYSEKVEDINEQLQEKLENLENDIREEEIKNSMISQDIEKLREHEPKFYSKCAEYQMYTRALELKKECEVYEDRIKAIKNAQKI